MFLINKHWYPHTGPHDVTAQKTTMDLLTVVRTSNLVHYFSEPRITPFEILEFQSFIICPSLSEILTKSLIILRCILMFVLNYLPF